MKLLDRITQQIINSEELLHSDAIIPQRYILAEDWKYTASYIIPKGTAFVLTGTGTDPNNDPITYLWEQMDNQTSTQPPVATATSGPIYRSLFPSTSPSRYSSPI